MPSYKFSPPPYQPGGHRNYHHSSRHRHSEHVSMPSYYHEEQLLHFYRWTSPPGVMKILSIIIVILCVAIFACIASTLAWDYEMDMMGMGGMGVGSMMGYGGSSYGSSYGSGISGGGSGSMYSGGTYLDPRAGKGFMIAIAGITFIAVLIIFIVVVSRQNLAQSIKFYLASIIICAILAFFMFIATIVYMVAVNPTGQSSSSVVYNQVRQLCAQYENQNQAQGIFLNQYLYHYCVVEPQEAIAIVLGFVVLVGLIILLVFAVKTRSQMRRWGPERILWEEVKPQVKVLSSGFPNSVGEWVKRVSGEPEALVNDSNDMTYNKPLYLPGDSDITSSLGGLKIKWNNSEHDTGSVDELNEVDFNNGFPPIVDEQERLNYKREFDRDHQEYKTLQAELDKINKGLADLDRELDHHPESSPQFLDAMEEYNRLKNLKKSSTYQIKKNRCKYLRSKLSHIKRKISDYDRRP